MENIADLLKDAFSEVEIDLDNLQFDEGTNTTQTQLVMDEDLIGIRNLWPTSVQGSNETFSDVYKQEEDAEISANSQESTLCYLPDAKGSTLYLPCGTDYQQVLKRTIMEPQVKQTCEEYMVEEESRKDDSEAGVLADVNTEKEEHFREEENIKLPFGSPEGLEKSRSEYQPLIEQTSPQPVSRRTQTMRKKSSVSDEEESGNCSAEDQTSHCKSDGNKDKHLVEGYHVGYDLRDFTEEDQEQVEESLADYPSDYPSDLSQSGTKTFEESRRDQLPISLDSIFCNDHSANEIKDLSRAENGNFQEKHRKTDCSVTGCNAENNKLEIDQISDMADTNVSLQRRNGCEDNLQGTNDYIAVDDSWNKEDSGDERDVDQLGYDSDVSNDDHSTSQEESGVVSSEKKEEWGYIREHNFTEDMVNVDDINYTETDKDDTDGSYLDKPIDSAECLALSVSLGEAEERTSTSKPSLQYGDYCQKEYNEQSTEPYPKLEIVQLGSVIKEHGQSPFVVTDNIRDDNTLIPAEFWSSVLLTGGDNLCLDEYNWNLTEEEQTETLLGEAENQEDVEETLEEFDYSEDGEEDKRDWEKEKIRIEAFYQFYGDQVETQDEVGRNHKVTFCLDHQHSEYEEDSESSEQEQDKEPHIPVTTVKPEYHSESDEPLQKLFHPEKPKMRPKEQQQESTAQMMHPQRNRCLAVLKSAIALGLMTAVGVMSFWWTTDNLHWTH